MAETPRSSFIPKQTTTPVSTRSHRRGRFNTLGFIAAVLLVASLLGAAGVFIYKDYFAAKALSAEIAALNEAKNRFNEADIARVQELDRQIKAGEFLLNNHVSPSRLLGVLEATTRNSVQFTSLSFTQQQSGEVMLTLSGVTDDFRKVALQSETYESDRLLAESVFGGLAVVQEVQDDEEQGSAGPEDESFVQFNVSGELSAALLKYNAVLEAAENAQNNSEDATVDTATEAEEEVPEEVPEDVIPEEEN